MVADLADAISGISVLGDRQDLFGPVASMPTTWPVPGSPQARGDRFRPRFLDNTEKIRCWLHNLATRFSLAVNPCVVVSSSAMNRYPNAGSSPWTAGAAFVRWASSQSRCETGCFFHL